MATLLLPVMLLSLAASIRALQPKSCWMERWDVDYTVVKTLHPKGPSCFEFCRKVLGKACTYTVSRQEGDASICEAYFEEGEDVKQKTLTLKMCSGIIHTCDSRSCDPCFPCEDARQRRPEYWCSMLPVRLRYGQRQWQPSASAEFCQSQCRRDSLCVWAEFQDGVCQINRLSKSDDTVHDVNITLPVRVCPFPR